MPSFVLRSAHRLARKNVVAPVLALALAAAVGCADDDAISPLQPDRDIAGMWIRYVPIPKGTLPVALPRAMNDTLFLGNNGTGQWSREITMSAGIEPLRTTTLVELHAVGPKLILLSQDMPCPVCLMADQARLATVPPAEAYRIYRTDADHFRVVPADPQAEAAYYYRQPVEMTIEQ